MSVVPIVEVSGDITLALEVLGIDIDVNGFRLDGKRFELGGADESVKEEAGDTKQVAAYDLGVLAYASVEIAVVGYDSLLCGG